MLKGTLLLAAAMTASLVPLPVSGAEARSCWLRDLASPSGSIAYAICAQGTLWVSTNSGETWTSHDIGTDKALRALAFLDVNRGIVVGDGGLVLGSDDAGKTWKPRPSNTKENLLDVSFVGDQGWAAGFNGTIVHSSDAGRTWTAQKTGTTQTIESIFFLDEQHGWGIGWAGTILRTVDGGANWKIIKTDAATWSLSSVVFKDAQNGWIVGFAGQILRSTDGGLTWNVQTSPVKNWLTSISFDKAGRGWVTFDDGFLVSEDSGENWKVVPAQGRFFLSRLSRMGDAMWALGQSALLRQTSGLEWKRIDSLRPGNAATAPVQAPTQRTTPQGAPPGTR